ncbi:MAG: sporulation protein [Oscillibacter sp.]|nr:sporulation protein [Oscillibacter sp.]
MMKHPRRTNLFLVTLLLVWFLADTMRVRQAASDALRLCAASVIPALFPFLVVTGLLMSLGFGAWASPYLAPLMTDLYRLPGSAGSALLLGFLGGYPVGARTAADLYRLGYLTQDETERLLTFCNNANPAFFISVLGIGVFHSARAGIRLLLIHILSALLTGLCFRGQAVAHTPPNPRKPSRDASAGTRAPLTDTHAVTRNPPPNAPPAFLPAFVDAVSSAASAMLRVCAFVTFFSVLVRPLKEWTHPAAAPLVGLLELFSLTPLLTPDSRGFLLASVCAGFGGLSALAQTAAVLEHTGLSVRPCLLGKLVQALFSALLAAVVTRFL